MKTLRNTEQFVSRRIRISAESGCNATQHRRYNPHGRHLGAKCQRRVDLAKLRRGIDRPMVNVTVMHLNIGLIMRFIFHPWQLYVVVLSGWINRRQQEVIEYLRTENQVLKEKLGKQRILLSDDQRRRLGVKGKILGRKRLEEIGTLFTPDTILRWHRMLVAKKWDFSDRAKIQPGRPRIRQVIIDLILQFAKENPAWG